MAANTVQGVSTKNPSARRPVAVMRDYEPDPPATPGPPRDLTKGRIKDGTCPEIPFFAPAVRPTGR